MVRPNDGWPVPHSTTGVDFWRPVDPTAGSKSGARVDTQACLTTPSHGLISVYFDARVFEFEFSRGRNRSRQLKTCRDGYR